MICKSLYFLTLRSWRLGGSLKKSYSQIVSLLARHYSTGISDSGEGKFGSAKAI